MDQKKSFREFESVQVLDAAPARATSVAFPSPGAHSKAYSSPAPRVVEMVWFVCTRTCACTDKAAEFPVFRPVIGMDKKEITEIARKIGTFETSIQPYEDCCTVFTPKHPRTKPVLAEVEAAEARFDFAPLIEKAVAGIEIKDFKL